MTPRRDREQRPDLTQVRDRATLLRWYWTKAELVAAARRFGLATAGNKPELLERIAHWMDTGKRLPTARRPRPSGLVDWGKGTLTIATIIDDGYRNTRNVRSFMQTHASQRFRFSNEFMGWMRTNAGRTLGDAVAFWLELDRKKREDGYTEASLPQNEYAQFSRAVAQARPGLSAAKLRALWKQKRSAPGSRRYQRGDEWLEGEPRS